MLISRSFKQVIIFLTYCTLAMLLGIAVYYAFFKAPETCFDQKQNQDETGMDCGGVCAAVCKEVITGAIPEVAEIAFVPAGNGRYDVLAKIHNPNDEIGASSFAYMVALKDAVGNVLATRSGKSYILPQESKYILELNFETSVLPAAASLDLSSIEWEKFSGYQERPTINIYQKRYGQISSGAGFSEAYGLLANESPYDFRSITVKVILRDASGTPLAFNTTEMRTVRSNEKDRKSVV